MITMANCPPDTTPSQPRAKVCAIRVAAMRMAAERGKQGITNALVCAATLRGTVAVGSILAKLTREGALFGVTIPGHMRHWFVSQAMASAWAAATAPLTKPKPAHQQLARKRPALPAPVRLSPAARLGQPIITEHTRYTVDARAWPTARWQLQQVAPDKRWPSFAATRPGIDPDTCCPWSDAVHGVVLDDAGAAPRGRVGA